MQLREQLIRTTQIGTFGNDRGRGFGYGFAYGAAPYIPYYNDYYYEDEPVYEVAPQ